MDALCLPLIVALVALAATRLVVVRRQTRREPVLLTRVRVGNDEVIVQDRAGYREMIAVGRQTMVWTRWDRRHLTPGQPKSGFGYVERQLRSVPPDARRVLVIGCGGGLAASHLHARGCEVTLVELHPEVVELARTYFELPNAIDVSVTDAHAFVTQTQQTWDAALVDVYGAMELPTALVDPDFYRALARCTRHISVNVAGESSEVGRAMLAGLVAAAEPSAPKPQIHVHAIEASLNVVLMATLPEPCLVTGPATPRSNGHDWVFAGSQCGQPAPLASDTTTGVRAPEDSPSDPVQTSSKLETVVATAIETAA